MLALSLTRCSAWAGQETDTSVPPPQVIFITEYVSSGSLKQFLKKTKKNHKAMNARVGSLGVHPHEGAALCLLGGVSGLLQSRANACSSQAAVMG